MSNSIHVLEQIDRRLAQMSNGEHPWQQIDRWLAEIKIGDASQELQDSFRRELVNTARVAREEGRVSEATLSSLIRLVNPLLEVAYRIYKEVWKTQGKRESSEFVMTLYRFMIVPRIKEHLGMVRSNFNICIDATGDPVAEKMQQLVDHTEIEANRYEMEWERKCRIEALHLEYKRSLETEQTEEAPVAPVSKRPGRVADENVKKRREIQRRMMNSSADFRNDARLKSLFLAFDEAGIPLPERHGRPEGWHPHRWSELLKNMKSTETKRQIETLRRDRFPKRKNVPKGAL